MTCSITPPKRRALQDIITCIRAHTTIDAAGRLLEANAERHFKPPAEMARLFRKVPDAVRQTKVFLDSCRFSLDELKNTEYPDETRKGFATPQDALVRLCAGRRPAALSGRDSRQGAARARRGAAADRRAQLCALLPDGSRRGFNSPATRKDSVPGARLGGQFGDLLLPRHYRRGSARDRSSVRAFRLGRAARAARHRCRFRARAARKGDPAYLQDLHARTRWPRRDRLCYRGRSAIRDVGKVFGLSQTRSGRSPARSGAGRWTA